MRAKQMIGELEESSKKGMVTINAIAMIFNALEDMDCFFQHLKKSFDMHTVTLGEFRYSPLFSKARKDMRMSELLDSYMRTSLESFLNA
jgi:hypothetical protein